MFPDSPGIIQSCAFQAILHLLKGGLLHVDQLCFCFIFWASAEVLFMERVSQSTNESLKTTNLNTLLLFLAPVPGILVHSSGSSVLLTFSLGDFSL